MLLKRVKSLIGLDVGTRAVKAVEITWNGGPVITGFGHAELPSPDAVPDTVSRVLRENQFHSKRVVTSVSGKAVIVRYLTMYKMSPEDLRNAIRYEADKYIPFDVAPFQTVERLKEGQKVPGIVPDELFARYLRATEVVVDAVVDFLHRGTRTGGGTPA